MKLRNKFLVPTIVLIIIGMVTSIIISYSYSKKAIEDMAESQMVQMSDATANQLSSRFKFIRLNISSWAGERIFKTAVLDTFLGESARDSASNRLSAIEKDYEMFENIVLFNSAGEAIASANSELVGKVKAEDMNFFQEALKGKQVVSEVFESRVTNAPIFVVSAPVSQSEKEIAGVLAGSVRIDEFNKTFIEPIRVGKTGYAYIYDTEGRVIAHRDNKNILKMNIKDADFGREMMKESEGLIRVPGKMIHFKKIRETDWSIAVVGNTAELFAPAEKVGYAVFILTIPIIIIVGLVIFFIAGTIVKPIERVGLVLKDIADGDLRSEVSADSSDEIGMMAGDLSHAVSNLRNIMKGLTDTTGNLSKSSEEMSAISTQMATSATETEAQSENVAVASEQVSASVSTVASATEQVSTSVSNIAGMTVDMSSAFAQISDFAQKAADNVKRMAVSGESLSDEARSIAVALEEMTLSLNEVAKNTVQGSHISQKASQRTEEINMKIDMLVDSSKQIGKVVSVIRDIADQTNMLALNATIEAAGAGEAGRGFAVVASEVKELAKQSAEATDEIAGQIEHIQNSTADVVAASGEISEIIREIATINETIASSIEEQTAMSDNISKSVAGNAATVKSVADDANESASLVGEIAKSTNRTSATSKDVAKNVDDLAKGVQEVAQSAGEAAQAVQDISKNIQHISSASKMTAVAAARVNESSGALSEMAGTLSEIIRRFKV